MWFEKLTGFKEEYTTVRNNLIIKDDYFISNKGNKKFTFGTLEIPTLEELKEQCLAHQTYNDVIKVREVVGDVQELHCNTDNTNALFQVASQFNLLEMVNPRISPEDGIDRYEFDYTQGPACAIACGAGTIFRNYFVNLTSQIGQTANCQIDCLDLIGKELNNAELNLWKMQNGYALFEEDGLLTINKKIKQLNDKEREKLKNKLKVGIQWNTEVTKSNTKHKVSQIFCAALPVSYCSPNTTLWEPFARIILEATYEATLLAGFINLVKNNCNIVYLTLVGGGAFGNKEQWVLESMCNAIIKFKKFPLDIRIVSYGKSNSVLTKHIEILKKTIQL